MLRNCQVKFMCHERHRTVSVLFLWGLFAIIYYVFLKVLYIMYLKYDVYIMLYVETVWLKNGCIVWYTISYLCRGMCTIALGCYINIFKTYWHMWHIRVMNYNVVCIDLSRTQRIRGFGHGRGGKAQSACESSLILFLPPEKSYALSQ